MDLSSENLEIYSEPSEVNNRNTLSLFMFARPTTTPLNEKTRTNMNQMPSGPLILRCPYPLRSGQHRSETPLLCCHPRQADIHVSLVSICRGCLHHGCHNLGPSVGLATVGSEVDPSSGPSADLSCRASQKAAAQTQAELHGLNSNSTFRNEVARHLSS